MPNQNIRTVSIYDLTHTGIPADQKVGEGHIAISNQNLVISTWVFQEPGSGSHKIIYPPLERWILSNHCTLHVNT
ncbi:unnamed protein product [Acanthoscelides obtectus]|uniref:Uncharacterized protein n=1 Tax=Acanthoscelides obtectus TaxID=200917 RepID=A0A9P0K7B1_ACAOB|nr:unnamed protein product [Acanthoscelides obtectus]CAK1622866.1 hypothetical protein AOBTE_LOCUS1702 [Acanthoscelides obtectus]